MLFDMRRGRPVPPVSDFVANFVISLADISSPMPAPVFFSPTEYLTHYTTGVMARPEIR
jgi:hypothetical protein